MTETIKRKMIKNGDQYNKVCGTGGTIEDLCGSGNGTTHRRTF